MKNEDRVVKDVTLRDEQRSGTAGLSPMDGNGGGFLLPAVITREGEHSPAAWMRSPNARASSASPIGCAIALAANLPREGR